MLDIVKKLTVAQQLKVFVTILTILALLWSLTSDKSDIYMVKLGEELFDEGFTQIIDGEEIPLENLADFEEVDVGETLIFECQVPTIYSDYILFFYTKDVETKVYIDGVLVYSFEMQEDFEFLKTPGNKWNSVDITPDMCGKTIRIELTSNFSNKFQTTTDSIYLIHSNETLSVILQEDGFRILMSIFIFIMAILSYVNAFIWKRHKLKKYFFDLANLYFGTAMWLFSMYSFLNYFINKPVFSYLVSVVLAIFLPINVYELLRVVYDKKSLYLTCLGYMVWGNFLLQISLQFIFKISLLDLLPLTCFIYVFGVVACVALLIHYFLHAEKGNKNFPLASFLIIFAGAFVEIFVMVVAPSRTDLLGVSSVFGLVIYLLVNHFYLIRFESKIDLQNIELEKNYNKLQSTALMQQIKGHFFFNTLNTISALCKYDAKQADNAILVFAKYMRSYMNLVNKTENISFKQELEIIEASLKIEKLRFPDTFSYELDLEIIDFEIPPLSIQPIVENSMIHGLRRAGKNGLIKIKTRKSGEYAIIFIEDDGMGFNTKILEKNNSVALSNLQKRIEIMVKGRMEITSEVNKGTVTKIIVPIDLF